MTNAKIESSHGEQHIARMHELANYIRDHAEERISLSDLSARAGLSPFHLQRSFKAVIGLTPRQFAENCRLGILKQSLKSGSSVTDAIYEAGFGSSSRVYEKTETHLGMTPLQYRGGGAGLVISHASAASPLGQLMIGATDRGICFVQFADSTEELLKMLQAEYPAATIEPMQPSESRQFHEWMDALQRYLIGEMRDLKLPLDLRATAFQFKVWRYLQSIPYGSAKSYGEVAQELGSPKGARAVARACASNRVALVIPCHRVIRGTGDLGGYKWGLDRKRTLLDHERRQIAKNSAER
jgi:AraC family transcriptional regulator, regulatory protein of adaptative response / methylated-DNA-[protein]-cysteine methyltransferase